MVMQGRCKYCGEEAFVEVPEDRELTQDAVDDFATMQCDCKGAKRAQERAESIELARELIEAEFEGAVPGLKEYLLETMKELQSGVITRAVIKISDNETCTCTCNLDGVVKFKHEHKYKNELEMK